MKSSISISSELATKPPTSTVAFFPKNIPFLFVINTFPLELIFPRMKLGSVFETWFRIEDWELGWRNSNDASFPILNSFH